MCRRVTAPDCGKAGEELAIQIQATGKSVHGTGAGSPPRDAGDTWREGLPGTQAARLRQCGRDPRPDPCSPATCTSSSCGHVGFPPSLCLPEPNPTKSVQSVAHGLPVAEEVDPKNPKRGSVAAASAPFQPRRMLGLEKKYSSSS